MSTSRLNNLIESSLKKNERNHTSSKLIKITLNHSYYQNHMIHVLYVSVIPNIKIDPI